LRAKREGRDTLPGPIYCNCTATRTGPGLRHGSQRRFHGVGRGVLHIRQDVSRGYIRLLEKIERAIPKGLIYLVADNLKTHGSALVRGWLEELRIEHAFIPKGAAWLNLIEIWWRLFRRQAWAGQDFADGYEID
jgi:transposase InsO family protein